MRVINASLFTEKIKVLCIEANYELPCDVQKALEAGRETEIFPIGREVLDRIVENFTVAKQEQVPICQDTGLVCVFLALGREVFVEGNLEEAVHEGVRQGYQAGYLRKSCVEDPFLRKNTNDNTPAMIYYEFVEGDQVRVTVAPKGFGSENMSQLTMLKPADGVEGVKDFVLKVVKEAGPNACPPIVVGVGVGGTFDKAALLAKKALMRPLGQIHPKRFYQELEEELLEKVNKLGIGPQGFGGKTTALGVHVESMATHIAGLPCGVNINCHVTRHKSCVL